MDEIYHDESLGTNINIVLVRMIMVGYRQVRLCEILLSHKLGSLPEDVDLKPAKELVSLSVHFFASVSQVIKCLSCHVTGQEVIFQNGSNN